MAETNYHPGYGHYLTVWEADGNVQVCLKTNGMIADRLHIAIETTELDRNATGYTPATNPGGRRSHNGVQCTDFRDLEITLDVYIMFSFAIIVVAMFRLMTTIKLLIHSCLSHLMRQYHSSSVWR